MPRESAQAEAAERFRRAFNDSTGCVTAEPVQIIPHGRRLRALRLEAELHSRRRRRFRLELAQAFTIREHPTHGPKAHTVSYRYMLDAENGPMLRYEWTPDLGIAWPHLHVYGGPALPDGKPFDRLHLPTGRVTVERLVWLLIEGFEVAPLKPLAESKRILASNERLFEHFKTW